MLKVNVESLRVILASIGILSPLSDDLLLTNPLGPLITSQIVVMSLSKRLVRTSGGSIPLNPIASLPLKSV